MKEYMLRASGLKGFDKACENLKLNPLTLLDAVGLPHEALTDDDLMISYPAFLKVLNLAAQMSDCPHFGLELSRYQKLDMLGPVGFIMQASSDVGTALRNLKTYFHLHNEGADIELEISGDTAQIRFSVKSAIDISTAQQIMLSGGIGVNILRMMCGSQWSPSRAFFMCDSPEDEKPPKQFFLCPVDYNQEFNGFLLDARVLGKPLSESNPQLHKILSQHLEQMLQAHSVSLIDQVKKLISQLLFTEEVSIDKVAQLLPMSRRKLQRQLKDEGTTFKALLDQVRHEQALRYLKESRIPLTQLSDMLGYAELSVFSRAFKRHTGQSPQQWRERYC
jgi:AraC-like DNA-binding protein